MVRWRKRAHRARLGRLSRTLGARYEIREAKWWLRSERPQPAGAAVGPSVVAAWRLLAGVVGDLSCNRSRHDRPDRHDLAAQLPGCTRSISSCRREFRGGASALEPPRTPPGRDAGPAAEPVLVHRRLTRYGKVLQQRGGPLRRRARRCPTCRGENGEGTQGGGKAFHGCRRRKVVRDSGSGPSSAPHGTGASTVAISLKAADANGEIPVETITWLDSVAGSWQCVAAGRGGGAVGLRTIASTSNATSQDDSSPAGFTVAVSCLQRDRHRAGARAVGALDGARTGIPDHLSSTAP